MKVNFCDIYNHQDNKDIVTDIFGVEETEIDNCVKIITAENKDSSIHNIYYARFTNSLHFKADKQLSITNWLKFKAETEINSLIDQDIKDDHYLRLYDDKFKYTHKINGVEDYISLYDLNQIVLKTNQEYNDLLRSINKELAEKYGNIEIEFFVSACIWAIVCKQYRYKLPVKIGKEDLYLSKNTENSLVQIYKRNEGPSLVKLNMEDIQLLNINTKITADLSYMYDELMKYASFFFEEEYFKPLINSNLTANITPWFISIGLKPTTNPLILSFSRFNKYKFDLEMSEMMSEIMNEKKVDKYDLIFKKAFIRIGNCPAYFQKIIYDTVNEQLEQQNKDNLVRKLKQFFKN